MIGPWRRQLYDELLQRLHELGEERLAARVEEIGFVPATRHRPRFVRLVGAIVGQRVRFSLARRRRTKLRDAFGESYTAEDLLENQDTLEKCVGKYVAAKILSLCRGDSVTGLGIWTRRCCTLEDALWDDMSKADFLFVQDLVVRRQLEGVRQMDTLAPYRGCLSYVLWRSVASTRGTK